MKKIYTVVSLIILCAVLLGACQPTPETPPVVSKNDGTLENALSDGADDDYIYTAPETYSETLDFYDGKLSVIIDEDTQINAAKDAKYPVYEVTVQDFDQETVKQIANVFFGDAQLEGHISRKDRETKSYIMNELIVPKKVKLADLRNGFYDEYFFEDENGIYELSSHGEKVYYDRGKTMEEIVAGEIEALEFIIPSLEDEYENAPANEPKSSPISLDDYKAGDTLNADIMLSDGRIGRLCIYDNVLTATYDYTERDDYSDEQERLGGIKGTIERIIDSEEDLQNYIPYGTDKEFTQHMAEGLDYENVKNQAIEFVKKLGLNDTYEFAGMGPDFPTNTETELTFDRQYNSYGIYFMRPVNDSLCLLDYGVCSVDNVGGTFGTIGENEQIGMNSYSEEFCYEKLVVWVGVDGVESIYWSSPLKIERELQSSVEIVPLETAFQNAAASLRRTTSIYDGLIHKDVRFSKFALGYTMMMEKNNPGYYLLVPTWIGDYAVNGTRYDDDNETVIDIYDKWIDTIAVNALDGSIINRDVGY